MSSAPTRIVAPSDVQEEREVLVVRANGGEQLGHAPGFQIMTMTMSSTTMLEAAWKMTPLQGPVQREELGVRPRLARASASSRALFMPCMYAAPVRWPSAAATPRARVPR